MLRERLDYKEHLVESATPGSNTLDRMPGRFLVREADVVVERLNQAGREVAKDIWKTLVSRRMLRFLEGKGEFLIEENEGVKRTWIIEHHIRNTKKHPRAGEDTTKHHQTFKTFHGVTRCTSICGVGPGRIRHTILALP